MVRIFCVFLLLVLSSATEARPQLILELNKTEIQLGHHVDARLFGINLQGKLIDIELDELRKNFGVNIVETVEDMEDARWPGQTVQSIHFKLYPRNTGTHLFPELIFEGAKNQVNTISVTHGTTKARHGGTNIVREIVRKITISTAQPWERQQVTIEVKVTTPDSFTSLRSESFKIPGFEVFPQPGSSEKIQQNDIQYSTLSIGWILLPLFEGQHNIELPPIEYRQSGKTLRTYYIPRQKLNVKPLPPYIPPTMPVGKIGISSAVPSNQLLFPSEISYWDLTITGYGVSPAWMPPIMRQVKSTPDNQFFATDSQKTITLLEGRLDSQTLHHIPYKPLVSGRLNLPSIRVQYFDPDSGKIITTTHQPQRPLVIGLAWRVIAGALLCLLAVLVSRHLYQEYLLQRNRRRLRQAALLKINNTTTFTELREGLNHLAVAEGWPDNLTIQRWAMYWLSCYKPSCIKQGKNFHELMNQLTQACYDKKPAQDFETYRAMFVALLRSAKRKSRYGLGLQSRLV